MRLEVGFVYIVSGFGFGIRLSVPSLFDIVSTSASASEPFDDFPVVGPFLTVEAPPSIDRFGSVGVRNRFGCLPSSL